MHTRWSPRGHSHVLAGRMPPVPPKSVWLQSCGEEKHTEQLPEVLGNRGKVFLLLGEVGVLMGRKLLRATICTEGTDLPWGNEPCGQHGQPPRHGGRTPYARLSVQQGEQELFNTPRKSLKMFISQARNEF